MIAVKTEIFIDKDSVAHEHDEPRVFYCQGDLEDAVSMNDLYENETEWIVYRPVGTAKLEQRLVVEYFKERK